MKDDVIKKVALDIGNNGIKLLVGEMSSDFQRISVTNYVKTKSKGISKSLIENPEALAETLREAIGKAESIESPITKLSLAFILRCIFRIMKFISCKKQYFNFSVFHISCIYL